MKDFNTPDALLGCVLVVCGLAIAVTDHSPLPVAMGTLVTTVGLQVATRRWMGRQFIRSHADSAARRLSSLFLRISAGKQIINQSESDDGNNALSRLDDLLDGLSADILHALADWQVANRRNEAPSGWRRVGGAWRGRRRLGRSRLGGLSRETAKCHWAVNAQCAPAPLASGRDGAAPGGWSRPTRQKPRTSRPRSMPTGQSQSFRMWRMLLDERP